MDGITQRAGLRLTTMLQEVNAPEEKNPRFAVADKAAELRFDEKRENDHTFRYGDRTVLLVDPLAMEESGGCKLDYQDGQFCFVSSAPKG
jgi:hypothetical protein